MRPACVSRCGWPHQAEGPLEAALLVSEPVLRLGAVVRRSTRAADAASSPGVGGTTLSNGIRGSGCLDAEHRVSPYAWLVSAQGRTQRLWDEWGQQASPGAAARTKRAARRRPLTPGFAFRYGQLEVRVTVFEVIGIPGAVGTLSESAEVPVAVAE